MKKNVGNLMKKIDRRKIERRAADRREVDQRVADRFNIPLKGTAVFTVGGTKDVREITTKNISAYGAYFETSLRASVSDTVTIRLPIEGSEGPFETTATVVRVDRISDKTFGIAVKFKDVPHFV